MKKAIIFQGWYQQPNSNWYPWLKKELEKKGYEVFIPDLPTIYTDNPNLQKISAFIDKTIKIDKQTIIIGHSLGAIVALRLAEKYSYKKMFIIAGWDFDDLTEGHKTFWKNKLNHRKITQNVKEIYCISSDNDPYTTAATTESMSKRLAGKFILIKGKKHFSEKLGGVTRIPKLLEYIK